MFELAPLFLVVQHTNKGNDQSVCPDDFNPLLN